MGKPRSSSRVAGAGNGTLPCATVHESGADGDRRAVDRIHPEHVEAEAAPHDIHDRVNGPDLVEMNRLDGHAVNARLRLSQSLENAAGVGLHGVRAARSGR
jgi:hypothetical protein